MSDYEDLQAALNQNPLPAVRRALQAALRKEAKKHRAALKRKGERIAQKRKRLRSEWSTALTQGLIPTSLARALRLHQQVPRNFTVCLDCGDECVVLDRDTEYYTPAGERVWSPQAQAIRGKRLTRLPALREVRAGRQWIRRHLRELAECAIR
jgi:hypothetical protein